MGTVKADIAICVGGECKKKEFCLRYITFKEHKKFSEMQTWVLPKKDNCLEFVDKACFKA